MVKRKWLVFALAALGILTAVCIWSLVRSNFGLEVTNYSFPVGGLTEPIRIVQLTDLHNSEFGRENSRLVQLVEEQKPDLIFITGDLLNANDKNAEIALNLLRRLSAFCPVYVSLGNHEKIYDARNHTDIAGEYRTTGAHVLEYEWEDLELYGQALRIGGFYGYGLPEGNEVCRPNEAEFQHAFQDTDRLTLLLTHMPLGWYRCGSLNYWDVDFVFTGHTHGGQIRLPLVGGLYAPDMGWFPGREAGIYTSDDGTHTMILSRGLGNTERIPRFNNVPEIVVVDLIPSEVR